jgi:hypothetical protein
VSYSVKTISDPYIEPAESSLYPQALFTKYILLLSSHLSTFFCGGVTVTGERGIGRDLAEISRDPVKLLSGNCPGVTEKNRENLGRGIL